MRRLSKNGSRGVIIDTSLFLGASVLFAFSQPNALFVKGAALLGWVCYVPIFVLLARTSVLKAALWGALYGAVALNLQGYWLSAFHPLAGVIVGAVCLFWYALLFFCMRLALKLAPRYAPLALASLWVIFEYLRLQGFTGYPYGLAAYSQWQFVPFVQSASVTGLWGVSFLLVFPQCLVGLYLANLKTALSSQKKRVPRHTLYMALAYIAVFCAVITAGLLKNDDYSSEKSAKVALIQQNADPWKDSLAEYKDNFRVLTRLSNAALEEKPDLVVWSETAFVPRIEWYEKYRDDPDYYALVRALLDYLAAQDVPFVVGNDDAKREPIPSGGYKRVDYNAALLFDGGQLVKRYWKVHLVPFTEYFPYEKQFPLIYDWLLAADTHFWEPGSEASVFEVNGIKFSTPICFEDSFPDLSRRFVQNGAELFVNMSNDAWSASLPAQYQHLSMAVFRAVENGRSMVRATASGQTAAVLPTGRVVKEAPPFTEAALVVDAPLLSHTTLYTKWGDWFVLLCALLTLIAPILRLLMPHKKAPLPLR